MHIAEGVPRANATKVWLTQSGKAVLASRHSETPAAELRKLIRVVEANVDLIREKWSNYFGELRYFC